jgi:hypothetical protein
MRKFPSEAVEFGQQAARNVLNENQHWNVSEDDLAALLGVAFDEGRRLGRAQTYERLGTVGPRVVSARKYTKAFREAPLKRIDN